MTAPRYRTRELVIQATVRCDEFGVTDADSDLPEIRKALQELGVEVQVLRLAEDPRPSEVP